MTLNEIFGDDDFDDERPEAYDDWVDELERLEAELEKHPVFSSKYLNLDVGDDVEPMLKIGKYDFSDKTFEDDKKELIKILNNRYQETNKIWKKGDMEIYLSAGSNGRQNGFIVSISDGEPRDR